MSQSKNRRSTIIAVLGIIAMAMTGLVACDPTPPPPVAVARDGHSAGAAGASCWGIKTEYPSSGDGTYWLLTAGMDRPAQFTCDMTTDDGGWVLVGRGRNGWTFNPDGQGSPASISNTPDGPGAFGPAALSTEAISGLLDGQNVDDLADGIRLERSVSPDGSTRQDYRLFARSRTWTWNLAAGQLLNRVVVDGTTYQGSNTLDTASSVIGQSTNALAGVQDQRRLFTGARSDKANQQGFGLGSHVGGGSSSADNYLWTAGHEGSPLAFTQVWLRPRIANDAGGFTPIPAEGFEAEAKPLSLKDRSEIAPWGVEGYNHDDEVMVDPWKANVMVIKVYGDRVYVGGRFRTVKHGPGGEEFDQGSLAAFDLGGNWISTFRPEIPGRVWDMTMTDDGKLIVGGDFTSVDGHPDTSGMAALDPVTGEVDAGWKGSVTRSSGNVIVRSLDSRGDWVYAAGRFNSVTGGDWQPIITTNAISLRASDGTPGPWHPKIHASAVALRVSDAADRVYLAGYFNAVNGDTNHGYYGITDNVDGSPVPGMGPFLPSSTKARYQQAVAESGDNILVGGAEHDIQMYDHDRTELLESTITKQGGDTQAIEKIGDYVYAACHCMNWIYQGTNSWPNPGSNYRAVDPIRMVGRFDAETMEYDTSWYPDGTKGFNDDGVWSIDSDSRECLWVGGDLVRGAYSGNAARDYLGGFARFCPTDATPPSAPSNLTATVETGAVDLTWDPATDDSGSVRYDVYRNDRVIATVYGTSYTDTDAEAPGGPSTYTVRAADGRGNRSASPAPVAVDGPAPELATPIPSGSTWSYADDDTDLGTAWRTGSTDGWASGPGPLGWKGSYATDIGPDHPTTTYFRRSFDIADPAQVKLLDLGALFTQGAVIYVNGVEVGRANMPTGTIEHDTVANQWVGGAENLRTKTYAVPGSLLHAGTNTIAAEVHGWRRHSGKVFFDLEATTRGATADTTAPTAPVLTAEPGVGRVDLSWTPATDDDALGGYIVNRGGDPIAVVAATATSYLDAGVDTSAPTDYTVTAFDQAGNATPSSTATVGAVTDPTVIDFGSEWNWWYQTDAPTPGWQDQDYDLAGWQTGNGELGFGDRATTTAITDGPAPRPLTSYYRSTIDVADPTAHDTYAIDLIANAGGVVYINGIEVARTNLPTGTITAGTYTLSTPRRADRHTPTRIEIPDTALQAGTNTIAVEVHNGWHSAPSMGFDLALTGLP